MKINLIAVILLGGVTVMALEGASAADELLQPVFRLNMDELSVWRQQWKFHRSADGELVLIGSGGPEGSAIASKDEGRTWHQWPAIHTWPKGGVTAVARKGKELLIQVGTSIWRSEDEGQTWTGGEKLLMWPQHVDKKLLWYTPGDRILVTKAGRLLVSVNFLLGGEGTGPEIIGSLVSEDNGGSWRIYELFGPPAGYPDRPEGFGEPKIVELADGRIWMVFRTCLGHLWQAFSTDGGRTWGKPSSTGLVSPAGPLHAQRVPGNNAVVVVWENGKPTPSMHWRSENNFWFPRRPLVFAVSHDNCQTWSRPVIITSNVGYMRNIYFSDTEMFINYLEKAGTKQWGPSDYRPKLVVYDLKKVLALKPAGSKRKQLTVDLGSGVSMKLVYIPAGEFMMGSGESAEQVARKGDGKVEWFKGEHPQHRVRLSKDFYMGVHEVTQAQYRAVMGKNPSGFSGDNLPVEMVSWNDAEEFCRKLSSKEGKTYRLPTEAEWEYSCRAGTATPFNTGATISTDQANYNGNYTYGSDRKGVYREKTTPVGSFRPNAWGLYDMHGNVWEWCSDWYIDSYTNAETTDPQGPSSGTARVFRGGVWGYGPRICRSASRNSTFNCRYYGDWGGFRVVLSVSSMDD